MSTVKSAILSVLESNARREKEDSTAKTRTAYLRDVHLALVLQRVQESGVSPEPLFEIESFVEDSTGALHIVLCNQRLGRGWKGKAAFSSDLSASTVVQNCAVEQGDSNDSVFCYKIPDSLDEWSVDFSLVFDPEYSVPEYILTPTTPVLIGNVHVDALDSMRPLASTDRVDILIRTNESEECLSEIWIVPSGSTADLGRFNDMAASKLLLALLFESVDRNHSWKRIPAVMSSPNVAELRVPQTSQQHTGFVNILCIGEMDGCLSIRVRSGNCYVHAAVLLAMTKRLELLLDTHIDGESSRDELRILQEKCVACVRDGVLPERKLANESFAWVDSVKVQICSLPTYLA
ncbi:hypothetical protein GGI07_000785 [Coemansia sp. Benny D115]|nr:hypothetical protein GGI07_000785 [Coemansia sp. Benny D115]